MRLDLGISSARAAAELQRLSDTNRIQITYTDGRDVAEFFTKVATRSRRSAPCGCAPTH
jgi:hypothetical protein